ncbi:hypothetical protein B0O99DRAFT_634508, partial [Bisporella sp. PMI_857]
MLAYLAAFTIPSGASLLDATEGLPPSWWEDMVIFRALRPHLNAYKIGNTSLKPT